MSLRDRINEAMDRLRWNQGAQFTIGAVIAFLIIAACLLTMTGCATVFDAPIPETPVRLPNPDRIYKCAYLIQGYVWVMAYGTDCPGWQPL